jgi:hypothetical protein
VKVGVVLDFSGLICHGDKGEKKNKPSNMINDVEEKKVTDAREMGYIEACTAGVNTLDSSFRIHTSLSSS